MNRYLLLALTILTLLAVACAPTATPAPAPAPTTEAMMPKESPTGEAMMPKESPTGEAMMPKETPTGQAMMPKETPGSDSMMGKVPDTITTPHFVDSTPKHGDTFAIVPDRVLINFDFTLHEDSQISVTRDGAPVAAGKTTLGDKKLSLSATLPKDSGDGLYVVKYKACWPDRSCHDGQFGFTVDSKAKSSYIDMTGKSEVTLRLKGVQFTPATIIVSKGTKVTWVNDDPVVHFVNSDPHPSHNAHSTLNSLEIKQGESYSFTFDQPGEWAYHCSAHVPQNMLGRIIVAEGEAMTKAMTDTTQAPPSPAAAPPVTSSPSALGEKKQVPAESLPAQLFAPHYVLSTPEHGALIDRVPEKVRIEFNFNLHNSSNITVSKDGSPVPGVQVSKGQFSLDATLPADAGDGIYLARYKACWPDGSCHDGQFAFKVEGK